jgi:hypothetical protein
VRGKTSLTLYSPDFISSSLILSFSSTIRSSRPTKSRFIRSSSACEAEARQRVEVREKGAQGNCGPDPVAEKENNGQRDAYRRPYGCRIGGFEGRQQAELGDNMKRACDNNGLTKPCREFICFDRNNSSSPRTVVEVISNSIRRKDMCLARRLLENRV